MWNWMKNWAIPSMTIVTKKLTTSDIESHMRELYDIGISDSTISLSYRQNPTNCKRMARSYGYPDCVCWWFEWDSKSPKIYKSWHGNWATLSTYFKYPKVVRRLIYTTNAIKGCPLARVGVCHSLCSGVAIRSDQTIRLARGECLTSLGVDYPISSYVSF